MRLHQKKARLIPAVTVGLLAGASALPLWLAENSWAGQRQFLVILATSPKEFNGGLPPGGLPNPQTIRNQYFDTINPNINSFAEYWKEISYGDVTISGQVTDWIQLPWAIQPKVVMDFVDMNGDEEYTYGTGEKFDNNKAMVVVDLNGDLINNGDNGPRRVEDNPAYARGAGLTASGRPLWTPGERFVDMDGDRRWDGYDEAANAMDWRGRTDISGNPIGDGRPDLRGPWFDLNGDNLAANEANCVYLPDADNDGHPDCCPNGPGGPGCDGIGPMATGTNACPPLTWDGPNDTEINDCNGNLVDDLLDIQRGTSLDRLPFAAGGNPAQCLPGDGDDIPDECQFQNPQTPCSQGVLSCGPEGRDPCCGVANNVCTALVPPALRAPVTVTRCEFDDGNGDTTLDVVEPFENFVARVKLKDDERQDKPDYCVDRLSNESITNNFPGGPSTINTVIARGTTRKIYGQHDPLGKVTSSCTCSDDTPCATATLPDGITRLEKACVAGEHAQYDPPDSWVEAGSMKMLVDRDPEVEQEFTTPEPFYCPPPAPCPEPIDFCCDSDDRVSLYEQAWRDRYNGADPPPWNIKTPRVVLITSDAVVGRREFIADRGGVTGKGTGWPDCGTSTFPVEFMTAPCGDFEADCAPTAAILPEESNGAGGRLIFFDGGVEFDDLPSSKYHRAGDQQLGEVTSPFNTEIWGQDRGTNDPERPGGGPDDIIPAAGPYATHVHGQLGRDAGNQLLIELLTWLPEDKQCAGGVNLGQSCDVDGDCPGSNCADGRCLGGVNVGDFCDGVVDCPGSTCVSGRCTGGANNGNFCDGVIDCPGSTCAKFGNDGAAWEAEHGPHPYAGPSGLNLGFRDYNLDGLIDLGEVVVQGTENYVVDPERNLPRGTGTIYPWNRKRLLEDCIEILDDVIDFDDFVDPVSMDAVTCGTGPIQAPVPVPFQNSNPTHPGDDPVRVAGICSGIVLLPAGSHIRLDFLGATGFFDPELYPIHNEDGLNDPNYSYANFPRPPYTSLKKPQLSWNLLFHDLVIDLGVSGEGSVGTGGAQTAYSAHEYLHTWEYFPDLYDYDIYDLPDAIENCPIGRWDIMADGGLVHPTPILKESTCTDWVKTVDLTTVLTPGVDRALTLPAAEFVRDDSYFFIENEDRAGERFYFWSAGSGFDRFMPGDGVLIMHTDVGSNPDALPQQQRSGDRPQYLIVQADGQNDLLTCVNRGDTGDPWPGSTDNNRFACNTLPASEWYTDNTCTGLEVRDFELDGSGSALVTFNWTPTSIPGLRFIDPPGGVTVGSTYQIRTEATDVYGGTWLRFFYTANDTNTPDPAASTLIRTVRKTTPGTNDLSVDWNIAGIADGRYFLFVDLIPDQGADGRERKLTTVRAGRNNVGTATLDDSDVTVDTSTIVGGLVTHTGKARSETWSLRCVDAATGKWIVSSSLTQPALPGEPSAAQCTANPTLCATAGVQYTSVAGAVKFTIRTGTGSAQKGALGDTFTFTTTGITAPSQAVTIRNGQIRDDPTAIIDASPLSGPPPLEVQFDARRSIDPNGQPLTYRWDFGDGQIGTGAQVSHTFPDGRRYTVTLRATNPVSGRYGEASVDIDVTNNTPNAVAKGTPTSGPAPLAVHFSATQSRDTETGADELIYQWDLGDGGGANDEALPGISQELDHTYSRVNSNTNTTNCTAACPCTPTGRTCTAACPCVFTAVLTVTDEGGKSDTDSVVIRVGNTDPVVKITYGILIGVGPLTVTFNAKDSSDAENDNLQVEWIWNDGTANEKWPAKTGKPPATDGSVPHTFTLPANISSRSYQVKAIVRDLNANGSLKGGETAWPGVTVTVLREEPPPSTDNRPPLAVFEFSPLEPFVGEVVNFDASGSSDSDTDDQLRYRWVFGDGGPLASFTTNPRATHRYASEGSYVVRLTVRDEANASRDATQTVRVLLEGANRTPVALIATGPRSGSAPLTLTFDGRISFDPDGDPITYSWEFRQNGALIGTDNRSVVTWVFATPGEYTVLLLVRDVEGLEGRSALESVLVAEPSQPPPPEPPPPRPEPEEPPDSAAQRPTPIACGLGMLAGVLASFLALTLTMANRRRLRA